MTHRIRLLSLFYKNGCAHPCVTCVPCQRALAGRTEARRAHPASLHAEPLCRYARGRPCLAEPTRPAVWDRFGEAADVVAVSRACMNLRRIESRFDEASGFDWKTLTDPCTHGPARRRSSSPEP